MTNIRREVLALLLLLAFALGLRAWVAHEAPVIGSDGYWFLRQARLFPELPWREAFGAGGGQHPGYAALISAVRPLCGGDLERAAYAVAVFLGAMTLIPVWGLTRRMAGPVAAICAAMILACLPLHVELSADTMSDVPMLCFAMFALWAGWEAVESGGVSEAAAAGLAGGLAYLMRPEGGGVMIVIGLALLITAIRAARVAPAQVLSRGAGLLALTVAFALVTWPLFLYIRETTGEWRLSMKWSPAAAVGAGAIRAPEAAIPLPKEGSSNLDTLRGRFGALGEPLFVANQALKGSHYAMAALALLGLMAVWFRRGGRVPSPGGRVPTSSLQDDLRVGQDPRCENDLQGSGARSVHAPTVFPESVASSGTLPLQPPSNPQSAIRNPQIPWSSFLLGGALLLYFALGLVLAHYKGYCGTRHVLILSLVALPWAGTGIVAVAGALARRGAPEGLAARAAGWVCALLVLVALLQIAKVLRPPRADQIVFREAGLWIREHGQVVHPTVCSRYDKIAWYAAGEHEVATGWNFASIAGQSKSKPLDYFVALRSDVEAADGDVFRGEPPEGFEEACSLPVGGGSSDELRIYRVKVR